MNLTTLDRVKYLADIKGATQDSLIKQLISAVSSQIERSNLFDRYIEQKARTEYFDTEYDQKIISVKGVPIVSITSLDFDTARVWGSGSAVDASLYGINNARGQLKFDQYVFSRGFGALKLVYTGGLAISTDRFIASVVVGGSGSFTASEIVTGGTSNARGTFVSLAGDVITIDVIAGIFEAGEVVTGLTSTKSRTLLAITQTPLVMAYPDLALACEIQVKYIKDRKDNLGLRSVSQEGGSISTYQTGQLLPEVKDIIKAYKIYR